MLNNTEKKSASGGKGRRGGERMIRTTEDWSFKRRDNHVRLIVPGGFARSKRIIHPCYFIPITRAFAVTFGRRGGQPAVFFLPNLPIARRSRICRIQVIVIDVQRERSW